MTRYNTKRYNAARYNTDMLYISFLEDISGLDTKQDDIYTLYPEFVFPTDDIEILISGKAFNDEINLSDWLSIKQNPFDQLFGD